MARVGFGSVHRQYRNGHGWVSFFGSACECLGDRAFVEGRQCERERASFAERALDVDLAEIDADQISHDAQAETKAFV